MTKKLKADKAEKTTSKSSSTKSDSKVLQLKGAPVKSVVNFQPAIGSKDDPMQYIGQSQAAATLNPHSSDKNNQDGPVIESVVSITNRRKRANQMRRLASKLTRLRKMARVQLAPKKRLQNRANKLARRVVRSRYAGKRGGNYQNLSMAEKMAIDRMIAKKTPIIRRLAKRLVPVVRKAETLRLQGVRRHKRPARINNAGSLGIMPKPRLDRAHYEVIDSGNLITEIAKSLKGKYGKHPSHEAAAAVQRKLNARAKSADQKTKAVKPKTKPNAAKAKKPVKPVKPMAKKTADANKTPQRRERQPNVVYNVKGNAHFHNNNHGGSALKEDVSLNTNQIISLIKGIRKQRMRVAHPARDAVHPPHVMKNRKHQQLMKITNFEEETNPAVPSVNTKSVITVRHGDSTRRGTAHRNMVPDAAYTKPNNEYKGKPISITTRVLAIRKNPDGTHSTVKARHKLVSKKSYKE